MAKPKIAVDIDDVLANSTDAYRMRVNKRTGADLSAEHYKIPGTYHRYYLRVWEQHGIADKVPMEDLDREMAAGEADIAPHANALETLRYLCNNFDLVVVTARKPAWQTATHKWIDQHFPGVFTEVVFAGSRHNEIQESKGAACRRIGARYLIDDNYDHAETAIQEGIKVIIFGDYGWHFGLPGNIMRCKDWLEVKKYFDEQQRAR